MFYDLRKQQADSSTNEEVVEKESWKNAAKAEDNLSQEGMCCSGRIFLKNAWKIVDKNTERDLEVYKAMVQ